jgi:hypothetical protein
MTEMAPQKLRVNKSIKLSQLLVVGKNKQKKNNSKASLQMFYQNKIINAHLSKTLEEFISTSIVAGDDNNL